jgi:cytochrome oxidase Cu insertion factor (SCO1/SenC/PrrC family)
MPGPSPRPPRAGPRKARAALEAVALAVVVGGVALVALTLLRPSSPATAAGTAATGSGSLRWTLHGAPAPALDLPDQTGQKTTIAALRGHVVLLTFLDSKCTNLCPIEGTQLAQVQRRLPATDRPERWLLGTRRTLAPVWSAYHIGVRFSHGRAVQTGKTTIRVAGSVAHTIALYLIDRRGRERFGYLPPFQPAVVAKQVAALDRSS